jgi:hypothetical protein
MTEPNERELTNKTNIEKEERKNNILDSDNNYRFIGRFNARIDFSNRISKRRN